MQRVVEEKAEIWQRAEASSVLPSNFQSHVDVIDYWHSISIVKQLLIDFGLKITSWSSSFMTPWYFISWGSQGFLLLVLLSASGLHIAPPLIVSITPPQASIQHRMAIAGLGKKSAEAQLPSQQILYKLFVLQCVGSCWLYTFCMYLFPFALYGANRVVPRQRIWDKLNQGLAQLRQTVDIMCP